MPRPLTACLVATAILAVGLAAGWLTFVELPGLRRLDPGYRPTLPSAAAAAHPVDALLWEALTADAAARPGLLTKAIAAGPGDPATHAAHVLALLTSKAPQPALEAAVAAGRVADPGNRLYDVVLAARLIDGAMTRGETPAQSAPRDAARAAQAADRLLAGGPMMRLRTYTERGHPQVLADRLGIDVGLPIDLVGRWAGDLLPIQTAMGLHAFDDYADWLERHQQAPRAAAIRERLVQAAVAYQKDARYLIEILVGHGLESRVRRSRLAAQVAAGDAAAVDRDHRVLQALAEAKRTAQALPGGRALTEFGVLDCLMAPIGFFRDVDPALGRRFDYRLLALGGLALLAALLLLTCAVTSAAIVAVEPDLAEATPTIRSQLGPALRVALICVLLPVGLYLCWDRLHPSRATGLSHQLALLLQAPGIALGVLGLLLWRTLPGTVTTRLMARSLAAGLALTVLWWGPRSGDRLVPIIGVGGLVAVLCLAAGALLAVWAVLRGSRRTSPLLAASAGLGFLMVLLVTATVAGPGARGATDTYLEQVIRPMMRDEVGMTEWQTLRTLDRAALQATDR